MKSIIVVKTPRQWPMPAIPGVEVVAVRDYLAEPAFGRQRGLRVYNLSRSYRYQSAGYYVSLLATARGHRVFPDIGTIQDLRLAVIRRIVTGDLDEMIQRLLRDLQSTEFVLSIYFGRNLARKYDRLAWRLYGMFSAPLLRAYFVKSERWELRRIGAISMDEVPDGHREFLVGRATEYFGQARTQRPHKKPFRYDLAILHDPADEEGPSDEVALRRFMRAAGEVGLRAELITREDYGRVAEYDALFIRATTQVNNFTYRFARRAEAENLAVIDDSQSIIRCTNKVYLAEALRRRRIPAPRTTIIYRDRLETVADAIRLPAILKLPDSSFSQGVIKIEDREGLIREAQQYFEKSDLLIAQEFIPTAFDWRVGVLDGAPLYACKYHMASRHWQIYRRARSGRAIAGRVEAVPLRQVPPAVIRTALRACAVIGHGLYGVDLKQKGRRVYVIEVNDNPSIEGNYEDAVLKDRLYRTIMRSFLKRIETLRRGKRG